MDKKLALTLSIAALACQVLASKAAPVTADKYIKPTLSTQKLAQISPLEGQTAQTAPLQGETSESSQAQPLKGQAAQTAPLKGSVDDGTLKGGVQKNNSALPMPTHIKLTAEQYKSAVNQYRADIAQFYGHVHNYQGQVSALKKLIGECNENEAQFQQTVKKNQLNINALQMPTITVNIPKPPDVPPSLPPPRACCISCLQTGRCGHILGGAGAVPAGPTQSQINAARMDAIRIGEAQNRVGKVSAQLGGAESFSKGADSVVMDYAAVEKKSQDISDQFGRLKKEYDTLKIERDMLSPGPSGSGTKGK